MVHPVRILIRAGGIPCARGKQTSQDKQAKQGRHGKGGPWLR